MVILEESKLYFQDTNKVFHIQHFEILLFHYQAKKSVHCHIVLLSCIMLRLSLIYFSALFDTKYAHPDNLEVDLIDHFLPFQ